MNFDDEPMDARPKRDDYENPYLPFRIGPSTPHYYGDYVRQIFFVCGAVMLLLSPFLSSTMPALLPFEIGGAILFVVLGALTSPRNPLSITANVIGAGVAVVAYEILALYLYSAGYYLAFFERELLAVAFLAALYFSLKTLRNMTMGKVGKRDTVGEYYVPPKDSPGDGDF